MDFRSKRSADLPALAWAVTSDANGISAISGASVEQFGDGLFEGAWAGDFSAGKFEDVADVFGSGIKIGNAAVLLVPPSHTLEPIYLLVDERNGWSASNSLALLTHLTRTAPDPAYRTYGPDFARIVLGIHQSPISVPWSRGTLHLLYHHNLLISDGRWFVTPKPLPPRFSSYASYLDHLRQVVGKVHHNAIDGARERRFPPVCTVSSGYDSPACAVLAQEIGCTTALTLQSARSGQSDSGSEIAAILGLPTIERDRQDRSRVSDDDAEFLAPGTHGEDQPLAAFRDLLWGTTLFSGHYGGRIWSRQAPADENIARGDMSGASMGEFRLWTNFIHFPIPYIAAQRHPDLHRISNSSEMKPFSVPGHYDRPIPRRIVEEAGVPRPLFGQEKNAASILYHHDQSLLASETLSALSKFGRAPLAERIWFRIGRSYWRYRRRSIGLTRKLASESAARVLTRIFSSMPDRLFAGDPRVFEHSHPESGAWLTWALARLATRYRDNQARSIRP